MSRNKDDLRLKYLAIGSLPHKSVDEAIALLNTDFLEIPFCPQLVKLDRHEDMIFQYLEMMPGIKLDEEKVYLDSENEEFFEQLEEFFMDYENEENLEKYAITDDFSKMFYPFLKIIQETKPKFAKAQIVGPITLATTLCDKDGNIAYYDETLREVITKTLILKALWQIKKIKDASLATTPIIFIDEPSISQLGTSAFITISENNVVEILKEVSDKIKEKGAISAIHCCGKCDWTILTRANVDIINLDAFFYAQSLALFPEEVNLFLENGGKIAWGIVPTLDKEALSVATAESLKNKFDDAIDFLCQKGIDKKLILDNSLISPSCGAGSLSVELAQKAMDLTKELSEKLRKE